MAASFRAYLAIKQERRADAAPPPSAAPHVRRADVGLAVFALGALAFVVLLGVGSSAAPAYGAAVAVAAVGLVVTAAAVRRLVER